MSAAPEQSFAVNDWPRRLLTVVTTCRLRDLAILEIAVRKFPEAIPCRALHVIAPNADVRQIRRRLGKAAQVLAEDEFIPGMTIGDLRGLARPQFPRAAGWYFQQLLKLQFAFLEPDDDYYLIWDADTVPLRPMTFFDEEGRMLLTKAMEHHRPYFETYQRLFGDDPGYEFSFIAQHMLVQKSVAREMLARIEERIAGSGNWAWKIIRTLPDAGDNLFSEYETYGHYAKRHYPGRVRFVSRSWRRDPARATGRPVPSDRELTALARDYDYVAFERTYRGWRRVAKFLVGSLGAWRKGGS